MLPGSSDKRQLWWRRVIRVGRPYLMILPACVVVLVLFVFGLAEALKQSLGFFPAIEQYGLTLSYYKDILTATEFRAAWMLAFQLAMLSSVVALVLGFLAALALTTFFRFGRKKRLFPALEIVYKLPMLFPHFAAAYMMGLLLMQSGFLARVLAEVGWLTEIEQFPIVVHDSFGWGIFLTYLWKEIPFVILMVLPVLLRVDEQWRDVAKVFGGHYWSYVRTVLLPLLVPAFVVTWFILFAFTFTAFEVPYLLGQTYPQSLPVYVVELYNQDLDQRPSAMAAGMLMVFSVILIGGLVTWLFRKPLKKAGRGWL